MSGSFESERQRPARRVRPSAESAGGRAPGVRQTQKEATRNRVVEAARELFDTQGYQGTTIREIARHAGVSVGSVFTTFASKGDILSQVMENRLDRLYAELDRVAPHLRGSTADQLRSIYAMFFAFEAEHIKLFLSHLAAAYDWTLPATAKPYGKNQRVRQMLHEILAKGVEAGDVDPKTDLREVAELLIATYAWTYRLVVSDGADAKTLTAVMDRQIGLIADGFRPR